MAVFQTFIPLKAYKVSMFFSILLIDLIPFLDENKIGCGSAGVMVLSGYLVIKYLFKSQMKEEMKTN